MQRFLRPRVVWPAVVLLSLLLAGCDNAPSKAADPPPSVGLSFIQQRIDEGTTRAQLRVVNREDSDIVVTGIGLDWPGYGGRFTADYDTTIPPGQTVDMPMILPRPMCSAGSGPAYGIVGLGSTTVRSRLDASGQGFVKRIWERACAEKYVAERVSITYGDIWRRVGTGSSSALHGTVRLSRRHSTEEIHLLGIQGSVLFGLRFSGRVVLGPDATTGSYPLQIRPGRCDEHGRSQSTQTFVFRASIQFDDTEPVTVTVVPDQRAQAIALAFLAQACR